jgi:hypothetical protein
MKPVPMYIGELGLYLSDTFSPTQSRLAVAVGVVMMVRQRGRASSTIINPALHRAQRVP